MQPIDITIQLFEDAAKTAGAANIQSYQFKEDGLYVTNPHGHLFVVNPAAGIDSIIAACFFQGVTLVKNGALELELTKRVEPVAEQEPEPAPGDDDEFVSLSKRNKGGRPKIRKGLAA